MKNLILLFTLAFFLSQTNAQGLFDKIKDKVEEKVDEKTDEAIDEATEEKQEEEVSEKTEQVEEQVQQEEQSEPTKKKTDVKKNDDLKTFSKFDFIPGEKVIFYDDFSQDAVGDFPVLWNTNTSGEVMTTNLYPGKWFKIKNEGAFVAEHGQIFPDNFTVEYDIIPQKRNEEAQSVNYEFDIYADEPGNDFTGIVPGYGGIKINFSNYGHGYSSFFEGNYKLSGDSEQNLLEENKLTHVAIWVQKQRIRVYLDEVKLFDLPRAMESSLKYNMLRFYIWGCEGEPLISNFRVAVGAPDMRSKLITDGKLVTRGILFDVNSDKIKPESYGTLKEIANVLKENADVRVKIIGHTDSDGKDDANLDLSKRRAASVKVSLNKDFGIEETRMETDGKGESEPTDKNDTPQGKANNRRVEFIKL